MPTIASADLVELAKSSSILSSAALIGMLYVESVRHSSLSCSRMSIRSTSPLTRLTKTTPALHTELRLPRLATTSTRRACHSSVTRTSASMRTEDPRRALTALHASKFKDILCWQLGIACQALSTSSILRFSYRTRASYWRLVLPPVDHFLLHFVHVYPTWLSRWTLRDFADCVS
jgi:hypothetical protein